MISDLRKQTCMSVVDFLRRQGQAAQVYAKHFKGIPPLLVDNDVYVFAEDNEEIVLVVFDSNSGFTDELADEDLFNWEHPLYFTDRDHRPSPVWDLAVTKGLIRRRLSRLSKHIPPIYGVLLTNRNIINYDEMLPTWKQMGITVFHHLGYVENPSIEINDDGMNDLDFPLAFIKEAKYDDWEIKYVEKQLNDLLHPGLSGFTQEALAKKLGRSQEKNAKDLNDGPRKIEVDPEKVRASKKFFYNPAEEDFEFDFDFGDDEDDDDFNDDVAEDDESAPSDEQNPETVLDTNRFCDVSEKCNMLDKIASVELTLSTMSDDGTPLYADGQVIVKIMPKPGELFLMDQYKCFIYTKDYYPICNSEQGDVEVNRSLDTSLTVSMSCDSVWLPGEYILLINAAPEDTASELARYDFVLDNSLAVKMGHQQRCSPCGFDDTLVCCIENRSEDWTQVARTAGMAQLRQFAVKMRQLLVYNDFRSLMNGGPIGYSQNLLIYTHTPDIDGSLFMRLSSILGFSGSFLYAYCARYYDSSRPNPYENLSELDGCKSRIVCLHHIGGLLAPGGKVVVRKVQDLMGESLDNSLWICGTRSEVDTLLDIYPSLGAYILKGNRLEQEPCTAFELVQAFAAQLDAEKLVCSPEAKDALARAVLRGYEQGGLATWTQDQIQRYVCEEVRPRYLEHGLTDIMSESLPLLSEDDLCLEQLSTGVSTFEESMHELNAMIGLDEVKQGIRTMANNARLFLERRRRGLKTSDDMVFHCIFTGNPGTGKTTVARMLGKIYHALGLLSKGEVIVADRTRLVGQYIGQTEDNMKVILQEARGNVLFIDEAYTLYDGAVNDRKDFGMRVIESLLTVLSQPNPDMLVVFAGYAKEMDAMLSTNPGLSGRFPYRYLFRDYSEDELMLIATRIFEHDEYILTGEAVGELRKAIVQTLAQKLPNFGNARWIEQFVKNGIIPAMADRIFSTGCNDFQRVEASDVVKAFEKFCPKAIELKPAHRKVVGFNA